jgi:RND family efflux transporter MFP subunit
MIVSVDPIYAYFDVDEQTVLRIRQWIREGQLKSYKDADLPVFLGLSTEQDHPHRGQIDFVENRLDPTTGTLNVRAVFNNPRRMLSPGLFARIRLRVSPPHSAVLVPERALGSDQGQRFIYVVNEKNIAEFRPVKVGRLHDGYREIQDNITPNDWIITNGLQRARPGAPVEPQREAVPQTQPEVTTTQAPK